MSLANCYWKHIFPYNRSRRLADTFLRLFNSFSVYPRAIARNLSCEGKSSQYSNEATMHRRLLLFLVFSLLTPFEQANAQSSRFDMTAYEEFLSSTESLSGSELMTRYPSPTFKSTVGDTGGLAPLYLDSIDVHYNLTGYEKELLREQGFMVTERFEDTSFGHALYDIYARDLPVYISSDMILHAVHRSYAKLLEELERNTLIPLLTSSLASIHSELVQYIDGLGGSPEITTAGNDLDVYLTVARTLLVEEAVGPQWTKNDDEIRRILDLIEEEKKQSVPLFSEECRDYDFSQLKPRGYYTSSATLSRYFQSMMWLGRTELYLSAPETDFCRPSEADVRRQTLMALILTEIISGQEELEAALEQMDKIIASLVGDSDNATTSILLEVMDAAQIRTATDILDAASYERFKLAVAENPMTRQQINAQILVSSDVRLSGPLEPAAAFLLLGQRFIIDSYILGHVVFSEVEARRMLPMSADAMFALGNNAAAQILSEQLDIYEYGPNLAALRYLVDGFEDDYWDQTFYTGWLNSIRQLNPPDELPTKPAFMRTAAWWQKSMTTQLASWAQIRHDNLLYAKQSYSASVTCEFPFVLVEPVPEFFATLGRFAATMSKKLEPFNTRRGKNFLTNLLQVSETLEAMAQNHLDSVNHTAEQIFFAQEMINEGGGSGPQFDGWYPSLFIGESAVTEVEVVVADVHTAPSDAAGNPVGWVMHIGTGPIDLAVINFDVPGVGPVAFTGPVMSYYEHVSTNFKRLTDQEWESLYAIAPSVRPDFVNLYLADSSGQSRGTGFSFATNVEEIKEPNPQRFIVANYPNPFSDVTTVTFTLPTSIGSQLVEIQVYDVQGRMISQVDLGFIPPGSYSTRWNPSASLASGQYFVRVVADRHQASRPITLVR